MTEIFLLHFQFLLYHDSMRMFIINYKIQFWISKNRSNNNNTFVENDSKLRNFKINFINIWKGLNVGPKTYIATRKYNLVFNETSNTRTVKIIWLEVWDFEKKYRKNDEEYINSCLITKDSHQSVRYCFRNKT